MRRFTAALLLAALSATCVFSLMRAVDERKFLPFDAGGDLVIPSPILKITSFEFKGIASDLLLFKAMVFMGNIFQQADQPNMKPEQWQWLDKVLTASTDLDPYFFDPYFLGNAYLTWDGGMVHEANLLLEKGTRYRDWDWMLPFFAGFNSFYFLLDNSRASEFLVTASKRPGPSEQLLSLASRLAYKERNTENSILFLEAILRKTEDKRLKKVYETRIRALQARLFLENAVSIFKKKFNRSPVSLQQMIARGILRNIPEDPYGGTFSVGPDGEIRCTSDYKLLPKQKT